MLAFMKKLIQQLKTWWFEYKAKKFLKSRKQLIQYPKQNNMEIDKTVPLNELSNEELLDLLDTHDCHLSPDDGCVCDEIHEILHRRSLERDLEEEKIKIKEANKPF